MKRVRVPFFKHVPVPTFMVFLGEGKHANDHQTHCRAYGYNVLHGYHHSR